MRQQRYVRLVSTALAAASVAVVSALLVAGGAVGESEAPADASTSVQIAADLADHGWDAPTP
ncbi:MULTISPECIES: hypothetical protein [unclassified Streptomyces]|uniref:hypothetical protein n=1 Tax=unclassified Streptomyces TaxID=2593676 RepID=UPI00344D972A